MAVLHLEALAGIALSLSILMALAWAAQQRSGNSGCVDAARTFSVGLVGAGSSRGVRYRACQSRTNPFFPMPPQKEALP
jgi:steroid 5-alpha reductase family enzyme